MDVRPTRRATGLLDLHARHSPLRVQSSGEFTDWGVVGPGFLALGARVLESIMQQPWPEGRIALEILLRSLTDYTITFAWLAAPTDDDERLGRLRRFELDEWVERDRVDKKYTHVLPERNAVYRNLIKVGQMPTHLMDEAGHQKLEELRAASDAKAMPNLLDMAVGADEVWMKELPSIAQQPLANVYAAVYGSLSFTAHGSITAVGRVATGEPPNVVVGVVSGHGNPQYGLACSLFTEMLAMHSRRVGWPDEEELWAVAAAGIKRPR